jgi:hypothetical protein
MAGRDAEAAQMSNGTDDGLFSRFMNHFENVWTTTKPIEQS